MELVDIKRAEELAFNSHDILNISGDFLIWQKAPTPNSQGIKQSLSNIGMIYGVNPKLIEDKLSMLFGAITYGGVMKHFEINQIRVCGAGLRYGVFFSYVQGIFIP